MMRKTCLAWGLRVFAAGAVFLGALAIYPRPALADTLLDNIAGISADLDGNITRFSAMVIRDDGIIMQIIGEDDRPPEKLDYRIDGRGRVVMPGMVDAHTHIMGMGFGMLTLDLSGTTSIAQAQEKIAQYSARFPERPWIVGRGWDHETWGLGRFPTAAELDIAVPDRPIWLERVDGHAGWANSIALEIAGIDANSKNPAGGRIERLASNGQPSGVLIDQAMDLITSKIPPPRPEDRDLALGKAQEFLLAQGVTAVADMGTTIEDWQSFRRAGDGGWLHLRIMAYADGVEDMGLIGGPGPTPWLYQDKLRLNGVKLYLDGALGSRGATLKTPYADDPGNHGIARLNPTQLRNLMSRAAIDNFQVAIHAIGDAANADALDAIEELAQTYEGDRRWRIEHAQIIDPADIARFGQNGIIASMQPVHQTSGRLMTQARLGPDRLEGVFAWRSILQAGSTLALGSDAPAETPDPFDGWATAISREDKAGQPFGGWQPSETISREQALAAYTAGGAYAGFAEGRFGRLAPGMRADFLVIDRDPFLITPQELRNMRVLETWVGGVKQYDAAARQKMPPETGPEPGLDSEPEPGLNSEPEAGLNSASETEFFGR